jgi:hypothetical protein
MAGAQSDPITQSARPPAVSAQPLAQPGPGGAGLLPARVTGLPETLWQNSDPERLRALMQAAQPRVPALRDLLRTLLLAEASPPEHGPEGVLHLAARLDRLLEGGAVEEALALSDIAGHDAPELFGRWADLSLLLGRPDLPCATLRARPALSQDVALRVFCTARAGDWRQADLVLATAQALGAVSPRRAALLERFLDADLAETGPAILPPVRPSPLEFRLFEALGEPLPTAPLPLAYSVLDLSGDNGWRAQIEAAERLARAGVLPPNRLLGLYTLRRPAASGGVWDRVAALQTFESAMKRGTRDRIGAALVALWPQMASAGLLVPFSELFADQLAERRLKGRAAVLARRAGYLSAGYETLSAGRGPLDPEDDLLMALARGAAPAPDLLTRSALPHAEAVALGFAPTASPPPVLQDQLQQGRMGEVMLRAMALFASGAQGNNRDLADALATLRAVGLEDTARRAALQVMLLDADRALR